MAYTNIHLLMTMIGANYADPWSCSVRLSGGTTVQPTQTLVDAIAANNAQFFGAASWNVTPRANLAITRVALIGTDGKYVPGTVSVDHNHTPAVAGGGAAGTNLPAQTATVLTWLTDTPRGLASKGRIYLPAMSGGIQNSGQYVAMASASQIALWASNLNGIADVGSLSVMSKSGVTRTVTSVRLDNRPDTQRRRSDLVQRAFTSAAITS